MADRQIIINHQGPLPLTAEFQTASDGPAMIFVSGSGYNTEGAEMIGMMLTIDDIEVGGAEIWSNAPEVHRAFVPVFLPFTLNKAWPSESVPPTYKVSLVATGNTTTDTNDIFQVSIVA